MEQSSTAKLVFYWAIVIIPLSWGVYHTLQAALKLFS
jgi:hypothetical protein